MLKISVENSKGLVEKLVPEGSGQAAVEKIISSIEKHAKHQKHDGNEPMDAHESVSNGAHPEAKAEQSKSKDSLPAALARSTPADRANANGSTRTSSTGRTRAGSTTKARSGSTGRGKQGVWREAQGPVEKGIGFKGARKTGKTGLKRWKNAVSSKKKGNELQPVETRPIGSEGKAAELKALLGVTSSASATKVQLPLPNDVSPDASAGLKALLGVGTKPLEAPDDFPPPPPPPPVPTSAADKLFQMISQQQLQQVSAPISISSPFNFTYVEEGKEPPAPSAPPQPHMVNIGFPPPPMPMPMPVGPYGHMPPTLHMQVPHPGMLPMPPVPMMAYSNLEQFPPLGNRGGGNQPFHQPSRDA